jgi:hypothetical protein
MSESQFSAAAAVAEEEAWKSERKDWSQAHQIEAGQEAF